MKAKSAPQPAGPTVAQLRLRAVFEHLNHDAVMPPPVPRPVTAKRKRKT